MEGAAGVRRAPCDPPNEGRRTFPPKTILCEGGGAGLRTVSRTRCKTRETALHGKFERSAQPRSVCTAIPFRTICESTGKSLPAWGSCGRVVTAPGPVRIRCANRRNGGARTGIGPGLGGTGGGPCVLPLDHRHYVRPIPSLPKKARRRLQAFREFPFRKRGGSG